MTRTGAICMLFFFFAFNCLAVNSYSQTVRLSMKVNNPEMKDAIVEIKKQTEFDFLYSKEIEPLYLANNRIEVQDGTIEEVLDQLFQNSRIQYQIINQTIVLTPASYSMKEIRQQGIPITGRVTEESGEPMPGVNVMVKGTTLGVVSDIDGRYSINVPGRDAVLVFSFIGFVTQEIIVGDQTVIHPVLEIDTKEIEEVVVVGYGTQKKVNLTGAISSFTGEELAKRQVGQSSMLLQGIAPGVVVTQRSGQPGSDGGTISIRGKTTISGGSNPLVLVDGIEMGLNNVDPALIESISILKDAASASIYGVRAANGVVLVTTKRAKKDHFSINYNGYVGWQSPTELFDKVNAIDHMKMINEAYTNIGSTPQYSEEYIREYEELGPTNRDKYPDSDWYDLMLTGSGFMQSHFLSVSGGSERIRAMASVGYLDQKGIIENTNYKRYTLRVNTDMDLTSYLSAWVDAHIKQGDRVMPSRGVNDAFHWATRIPANQAARLSDGRWGVGWNGDNPVAFTNDGGLRKYDEPSVTLNIGLKLQPVDWFWADVMFAPNYWQSNDSEFRKAIQTYRWDGSAADIAPAYSTLHNRSTREYRNMFKASLNAEKTFGKHYLKGLVGYQQEVYHYTFLRGYRERYLFPDYPELDAGGEADQKSEGRQEENALLSGFGRINYVYDNRYLLEANLRIDASSRFAKGNRVGYFPSVSAGWRISEEAFWAPIKDIVGNFKLRASWGALGNQDMGNYPTQTKVNVKDPKYVFDRQVVTGAAITGMANPELVWERTTAYNFGLDLTLFRRLNIVAEYYYKLSKDILLQLDIPTSIGLSKPWQNAGEMENRGWDLGISYGNWENEFKYEIGFNISDVKNKILDMKGTGETGITAHREGYAMHSIYALEAIGLISDADYDTNGNYLHASQYGTIAPGDIKYRNQNPDEDNEVNDRDRVVIGGTIPRFTYGMNVNMAYKGFDFLLQLQGVGKADGYIRGQGVMPFVEGGSAMEMHKARWTKENPDPNAPFPRFAFNSSNNEINSSFWMKNAAYLRVKNVQLGYTLPINISQKMFINKLRVYVSGQNLLTFDDFWDGFDVEAPVGNGGYYPQVKTYSIGLDITF